ELGRADQEPPARPARAQTRLPVTGTTAGRTASRHSRGLGMKSFFLAVALFFAGLAGAQTPEQKSQQQRQVTQPGNNADVWREVQRGEPNYTRIPGRETSVLIQPPA